MEDNDMTDADLERIFEDFKRSEEVDREAKRITGMLLTTEQIINHDFEVVDIVDNLVALSEKEGFKYGFKTALLFMMNKWNSVPETVVDIQDCVESNQLIDEEN